MNLEKLTFGFSISVLVLLAFAVSVEATCLTTEQVISLHSITEELNLTGDDRSAFLSVFDSLCNYSYSKTEVDSELERMSNIVEDRTTGINTTVRDEIDNYTSWFEERESISDAFTTMAEIVNVTKRISDMEDTYDAKNLEYIDIVDDKLADWKEEKEGLATKEMLYDFRLNTTRDIKEMVTGMITTKQSFDYTQQGWMLALVAIVAVIAFFGYKKFQAGRVIEEARTGAPAIKHDKLPEHLEEKIIDERIKKMLKKQEDKVIWGQQAELEADMEDEKKERDLKERLKDA